MPIRGILAIPGADKVLKKAANTKFLHKGVKFGGEIKGFFAEWEKISRGGFLKHFRGEWPKNFLKKFLHSSALFRKNFAHFTIKRFISEDISI